MPEGDTLHRIEAALAPLVGHRVDDLQLPRQGTGASVIGEAVVDVEAIGKNLLVTFGGGLVLHTHLKMTGLWHRYARGEPWRRRADLAVAVLVAGPFQAVCFQAPIARLVPRRRIERELLLPLRGLDIVRADLDVERVLVGLRALPADTPLGVALLDQGVVAGIGNVYKSEACFRARLSPAAPLATIDDARLRALLEDTARVMRDNVAAHSPAGASAAVGHYRYERTTTTGCERGKGPIAVYGRAGEPCFVCGARIVMFRQGPLQRSSYACPRCQPFPPTTTTPSSPSSLSPSPLARSAASSSMRSAADSSARAAASVGAAAAGQRAAVIDGRGSDQT
jgi:endonuclease-8